MATKSKPKKPSALIVQEQLNTVLPQLLGNSLRVALDAAETQITGSTAPDQAEPVLIADIVDNSLSDAADIVRLAQGILSRLDPGAIKIEIRRRTKK